jgi:hypothetical protein
MTRAPSASPVRAILCLGAALRLTRFVVADDLPGQWWIKDPLDRAIGRHVHRKHYRPDAAKTEAVAQTFDVPEHMIDPNYSECRLEKYRQGLDCPFCVGQWIAFAVVAIELATSTRRGSKFRGAWTALAAALTLNETAAHIGARLGDTAE